MSQDPVSAAQQVRNFVSSFRAEPGRPPVDPKDLVDPAQPKDWTVLAYMEGRDRLSNSVDVALNGMEEIGSTDSVNLVAQATLVPEMGDRRFQAMGEVNTRRYYVTRDGDARQVSSPVVEEFDEQKRLTAQTFEDYVCWGVENFPAKHYAVIIKKHGLGFATNGSTVPLSARELREALEKVEERTGVKPEVLCWDACNMQQWEVAYELKDRAQVMTGSPEAVPAVEFPYPTLLHNLVRYPKQQTAETLGQTVVQSYAAEAPQTTQFALDLKKLQRVGSAVRGFVESVLKEQVPRDRLYTNLMKSASFEPKESLSLAYNFRDVAGFLRSVIDDPEIASEEVKKRASVALSAMKSAQLDANVAPERAHLKGLSEEVGPSAFMPWKEPSTKLRDSYAKLSWAKDTEWDKFLEYTLGGGPVEMPTTRGESRLPHGLGKLGLYTYKKYVSPYLLTDCPYDTTCSEYARIALEDLGPWEGAKWAFMRVVSCQDGAIGGNDGMPGHAHEHSHEHAHAHEHSHEHVHRQARVQQGDGGSAGLTLSPPPAREKSESRKRLEHLLFKASRSTGKVVGGTVAAMVGGLTGAALGGVWGAKAGSGTLEKLNEELRDTYGETKVASLQKLQAPVAVAGTRVRKALEPYTGQTVAAVVGGVTGGISGLSLGLLGGAFFAYRFFGGMAGLAAQNMAKDAVEEMPVHYKTELILRKSYEETPKESPA